MFELIIGKDQKVVSDLLKENLEFDSYKCLLFD